MSVYFEGNEKEFEAIDRTILVFVEFFPLWRITLTLTHVLPSAKNKFVVADGRTYVVYHFNGTIMIIFVYVLEICWSYESLYGTYIKEW
jgi:hypothetical protein